MNLIPWRNKDREEVSLATAGGLRSEMDRLFNSFFGEHFGDMRRWGAGAWGPPLDVEETDKEITVRAEVPGVKAEEIELSINDKSLIISGEKKESTEKKEQGYFYQERHFGSFRREVPLPAAVNPDTVVAEYKDGVLNVKLGKAQEALPKRIQVTSK